MSIETWAAFVLASAILLVIPGPTVLLIVSYAVGQGFRTALPMALGVAAGDFTAMSLSMLGLGAVLSASASVYLGLRWAGAAYLVWLGIKLWRAGGASGALPVRERSSAVRMFGHAWLVTALNPKGLTFFVAFLPQFIDPAAPFLRQLATFEATFMTLACANTLAYAGLAARARGFLRDERALRAVNRVGGSILIGAGVAAATVRTS